MAWFRSVLAYRGYNNQVAARHESLLQEIHSFFQSHRMPAKPRREEKSPQLVSKRVLTLPWVCDWYESMSADPSHWTFEDEEDEKQLFSHVVKLHSLGIPTLLQEELHPFHLQKFWISFQAFIDPSKIDAVEAGHWVNGQCSELKKNFLDFVVKGMVETAKSFFGADRVGKQLVAVLDSSGQSETMGAWTLNLRVCFQGLAVTQAQLVRCRSALVGRLEEDWIQRRRSGWEAGLQAQPPSSSPAEASDGDSLWANVVLKPDARQPLAWCDTVLGLTNEQRPLVPFVLMMADVSGQGTVQAWAQDAAVDAEDWCMLGSVWSEKQRPTVDDSVPVSRLMAPEEQKTGRVDVGICGQRQSRLPADDPWALPENAAPYAEQCQKEAACGTTLANGQALPVQQSLNQAACGTTLANGQALPVQQSLNQAPASQLARQSPPLGFWLRYTDPKTQRIAYWQPSTDNRCYDLPRDAYIIDENLPPGQIFVKRVATQSDGSQVPYFFDLADRSKTIWEHQLPMDAAGKLLCTVIPLAPAGR